ncbi:unnamed protein product [Caenorhabditis auriculariae]|uniref:Uncharacterized protein n=1 Tax=Caenorhabditis auriculariae TaxID=2777116 RepID=A0A8S1HK61_9PELO|nr:unnamed protein product [Caenorhabditis auriculariae]
MAIHLCLGIAPSVDLVPLFEEFGISIDAPEDSQRTTSEPHSPDLTEPTSSRASMFSEQPESSKTSLLPKDAFLASYLEEKQKRDVEKAYQEQIRVLEHKIVEEKSRNQKESLRRELERLKTEETHKSQLRHLVSSQKLAQVSMEMRFRVSNSLTAHLWDVQHFQEGLDNNRVELFQSIARGDPADCVERMCKFLFVHQTETPFYLQCDESIAFLIRNNVYENIKKWEEACDGKLRCVIQSLDDFRFHEYQASKVPMLENEIDQTKVIFGDYAELLVMTHEAVQSNGSFARIMTY